MYIQEMKTRPSNCGGSEAVGGSCFSKYPAVFRSLDPLNRHFLTVVSAVGPASLLLPKPSTPGLKILLERIRELSTIKVLGFFDKEVTMYIYREKILLTIIGIFAGFGVGELLHQYIITVVPPDEVMFNPALGARSFVVPVLIITVVTIILGMVVNHRLKNVDMLEALKSVD